MTPQDKIKLAVEHINNVGALFPLGEPFPLSVYDLPYEIQGKTFANILTKIEQEYKAIKVLSLPYDANGNDYNPISDDTHEVQNSYVIELTDGYRNLCETILDNRETAIELPKYLPYYIRLMLQCIEDEKIDDDNQPKKTVLVNWFSAKDPSLSGNDIEKLATFVRNPEKRTGGWQHNKKKGDS
tara:strand:+ start:731 stop:1282 length:552 start_codon:yes stop_codon:yes gene_type:complete